jgi:hypothetical protein
MTGTAVRAVPIGGIPRRDMVWMDQELARPSVHADRR